MAELCERQPFDVSLDSATVLLNLTIAVHLTESGLTVHLVLRLDAQMHFMAPTTISRYLSAVSQISLAVTASASSDKSKPTADNGDPDPACLADLQQV